jgi:hypothetical protein
MSRPRLEVPDDVPDGYRQLIRQNDRFVWAMTLALRSGAESAAAMTATVRTTKGSKGALSRGSKSDSSLAAA